MAVDKHTSGSPWSSIGDEEHARVLKWQESAQRRVSLYIDRKASTGGRNLGPKGSKRAWQEGRPHHRYYVVQDFSLLPGTVLSGGYVVPPSGGVMEAVPLCAASHTRGQAKKTLRKVRERFPAAYVCEVFSAPDGPSLKPTRFVMHDERECSR